MRRCPILSLRCRSTSRCGRDRFPQSGKGPQLGLCRSAHSREGPPGLQKANLLPKLEAVSDGLGRTEYLDSDAHHLLRFDAFCKARTRHMDHLEASWDRLRCKYLELNRLLYSSFSPEGVMRPRIASAIKTAPNGLSVKAPMAGKKYLTISSTAIQSGPQAIGPKGR